MQAALDPTGPMGKLMIKSEGGACPGHPFIYMCLLDHSGQPVADGCSKVATSKITTDGNPALVPQLEELANNMLDLSSQMRGG